MKGLRAGLQVFVAVVVGLGGLSALIGFLLARFAGLGPAAQGVGWAMCIGGALVGLVVAQSGSPSRMAMGGRWGAFGKLWGGIRLSRRARSGCSPPRCSSSPAASR